MFNVIIPVLQSIVYTILPIVFLVFYRWFLLWIPFLPVSGLWIASLGLSREFNFVQSYMELVLVFFFTIRWLTLKKDRVSVWLLGIALLSIPSLLNSSEHFFLSLFLFLCLLGGAGIYRFFLDNMKATIKTRMVDLTVLVWVCLGTFIKFYDAVLLSQDVLYQRGGSIWGSNHVAGIILLLLPLVKSRLVFALALMLMVFNFSRGIYLGLIVYGITWFFLVSRHKMLGSILSLCAIIAVGLALAPPEFKNRVMNYFIERVAFQELNPNEVSINVIIERALNDDRWNIYSSALRMAEQVSWTGVGLGGFVWGLESMGYPGEYSNAHDMYLTALTEGGLMFAIGLVCLLVYLLYRSFSISRPVFVGVLTWTVYGLYSGEIYEASRFLTAGDYYYLMFVLAYISYSYMNKVRRTQKADADPHLTLARARLTRGRMPISSVPSI